MGCLMHIYIGIFSIQKNLPQANSLKESVFGGFLFIRKHQRCRPLLPRVPVPVQVRIRL